MIKKVIFIICEFYAYLLQQILEAGDIRRILRCAFHAFSQDIFIRTGGSRSRLDHGTFFAAAFRYDLITLQARCKSRLANARWDTIGWSILWANTRERVRARMHIR